MKLNFWKLSQGSQIFSYAEVIESVANGLVYVHKDTKARGTANSSQASNFINAPIGDYFYLTHGNEGMYLIGQFSGPANLFSKYGEGWLERPYKFIFPALTKNHYSGEHKSWSPQDRSTFTKVKDEDLELFEQEILMPHFGIDLQKFGVDLNNICL